MEPTSLWGCDQSPGEEYCDGTCEIMKGRFLDLHNVEQLRDKKDGLQCSVVTLLVGWRHIVFRKKGFTSWDLQ